MKKYFAFAAAGLMAFNMFACGAKNEGETPESSVVAELGISTPLELLSKVWSSYGENDLFPAAGGDFSEENNVMDAPGKYDLADAEAVNATLALPVESIGKVDDAASLVHMMNANTFTAAAFHVKDCDASDVADDLKTSINERQWMCGMPDKMLIVTVEDYVVSAFGEAELMTTFESKLTEAFPSAVIFEKADITV